MVVWGSGIPGITSRFVCLHRFLISLLTPINIKGLPQDSFPFLPWLGLHIVPKNPTHVDDLWSLDRKEANG